MLHDCNMRASPLGYLEVFCIRSFIVSYFCQKILKKCHTNVSTCQFADDTDVFLANNDCYKLADVTIEALRLLKIWLEMSKLTLHIGKTTFAVFYASKHCNHVGVESFCFKGTIIRKSYFTKYFGRAIDENLTWTHHVNDLYICGKSSAIIQGTTDPPQRHYVKVTA